MSTHETSYDELPYPSSPLDYCHPRRLEAMAALFGMDPPPVPTARVLELGCGDGSHLLPQAECYPSARFVGIDSAESPIAQARSVAETLQLTNVELHHGDIRQVDRDWGEFDYVVAHGLYSWVPPEVQDALLRILQANLAPSGVAYVSYNTLPGWHRRAAVRDVMLFYTEQYDDPRKKAAEARRVLQWVADAARQGSSYRSYLEEEIKALANEPDGYLYHEYLEEHNRPMYFRDFVSRAAAFGLQYLGEAIYPHMRPLDLPAKARDVVEQMPLEDGEQLMDFARNRMFRRTLLCRRDVALDRDTGPESLSKFQLSMASEVDRAGFDLKDPRPAQMLVAGTAFTVTGPSVKAAVAELCGRFPATMSLADLCAAARDSLAASGAAGGPAGEMETGAIESFLWQLVTYAAIDFYIHPGPLAAEVSPRPAVSPLARYQAKLGDQVTNRKHVRVPLDALSLRLVALLDGNHPREEIVGRVAAEGGASEQQVAAALEQLCKQALLVA